MEFLFGGSCPQRFISSLDKFPSRVSSTMDLIRVELPSRVSSTMELMSVQQQIPGRDSVCSPAETLPILSDDLWLLAFDAPHQI